MKKYFQEVLLLLHLTGDFNFRSHQNQRLQFSTYVYVFCVCAALVAGTSGRCSLFGRHHIHTFDGVLYEFPGDCSYLLAGDCKHRSFTLLGESPGWWLRYDMRWLIWHQPRGVVMPWDWCSAGTQHACFLEESITHYSFYPLFDSSDCCYLGKLLIVSPTGDLVGGKRTGVTLFLGDAFELHLSVNGRLSQGDQRLLICGKKKSVGY